MNQLFQNAIHCYRRCPSVRSRVVIASAPAARSMRTDLRLSSRSTEDSLPTRAALEHEPLSPGRQPRGARAEPLPPGEATAAKSPGIMPVTARYPLITGGGARAEPLSPGAATTGEPLGINPGNGKVSPGAAPEQSRLASTRLASSPAPRGISEGPQRSPCDPGGAGRGLAGIGPLPERSRDGAAQPRRGVTINRVTYR